MNYLRGGKYIYISVLAFANMVDKMMVLTSMNIDAIAVCRKTWAAQIKDAMNVNGGDIANATTADYALHLVSFGWKVLFSLIPPPTILGGWLCFIVSLAGIGLVTAIIGDIASTFGCVVGLRDAITGKFAFFLYNSSCIHTPR